MTDVHQDFIIANAEGRQVSVGKGNRQEEAAAYDREVLSTLARLEESLRHLAAGSDRLDSRLLRLENELRQGRWSLHDTLFCMGISAMIHLFIDFLTRLVVP